MRASIDIFAALLITVLAIASPVLISFAAYQLDPVLGGAGLVVGLFVGPYGVLHIAALVQGW